MFKVFPSRMIPGKGSFMFLNNFFKGKPRREL